MRGSYTNWDLIEEVFKYAKTPLGPKEIWDIGVKLGLDKKTKNKGLTPSNSISSMFQYREKIGNDEYIKVGSKWKPKNMES